MDLFKLAGNIVVDGKEAIASIKQVEDRADSAAGKMKEKFKSSMQTLGKWAKRGAAVGGAAMAGLAATGVREFASFEKGMREAFTLIPDASEEMRDDLTEDIKDVGEEYGFLADDTVPALYQALSAGIPSDNVMDFMDQAAQSARAGVTDLQTSVDTLSSVVNAYGTDVINAQEASDILFTTVKEGKTTFPELGSSIANVTPLASNLGVAFEDIGAAIATMTKQGLDSQKTTNYLRRLLQELSQQGMDAFEAFEKAAGQTFPQFIEQGGNLGEALQIMTEHADNTDQNLGDMFGRVQAGQAAMMLTGANMEEFTKNIDEMGGAAGATKEAYKEMSDSLQQTLDELRVWWQNNQIEIGEALKGELQDLLDWLESNEDDLEEMLVGTFEGLIDAFQWIVENRQKTVDAIKAIGVAFTSWKIAALTGNLWGLAAALAAVTGIAISDYIKDMKEYGDFRGEVGESFKDAQQTWEDLDDNQKRILSNYRSVLQKLESAEEDAVNLSDEQIERLKKQKEYLEERLEALEVTQKVVNKYTGTEEELAEEMGDTDKNLASLKNTISELDDETEDYFGTTAGDEDQQFDFDEEDHKEYLDEMDTPTKDLEQNILDLDSLLSGEDGLEGAFEGVSEARKKAWAEDKNLKQIIREEKEETDEATESVEQLERGYGDTAETLEGGLVPGTEEYDQRLKELGIRLTEAEKKEKDALEIKEDRIEELDKEIAKHEALGEEYDETEMRTRAYKDIIEKLIDAELKGTEVYDKLIAKLKGLQDTTDDLKVSWDGFAEDLEDNISSTLTNMITDFENFGDHLDSFFDSLTRNIIKRYTDKWAKMIVKNIPVPGGGDGSGGGINWGSIIETGINWFASAQEGAKITGETLIRAGDNKSGEEVVLPLDQGVMSELAGNITESMKKRGGGGDIGEVHVYQVEGMSDRAFVDGVQRNADSVKAQILDAVSNNESLRRELRRALA